MKYQDQQPAESKVSATQAKQPAGCRSSNSARGFTLIEVLIAMAIFAFGILAVTTMQMRSIGQNSTARMQTEATNLAADWMETLLALPYDDPWLTDGATYELPAKDPYTVECTIEEDPGILVGDWPTVKMIFIEVKNENRNFKPVTLTSFKGQGQAAEIAGYGFL